MQTSLKILVVDDEPDLAPLIRQKFRRQIREGLLDFLIAHDGVEALERLEESPEIDLVLTDINMPRMDGLTLLSRLPETGGHRKAIVVTAYGDMENIRTAMNRGAFDFLTKPIDLDDLDITIQNARIVVDRERKAAMVRQTFGRYVSDKVVTELLDRPGGIKLGGEKRVVTMMMSDLRGFSMVSERLAPEQVLEVLNIYLGKMADVITAFDGTIDEFIGDGILSIFGAPVQGENDAQRAVACAVAMQLSMQDVNAELLESDYPPLEMGIGINTGEVVVGNIGSDVRAKYGVVGSNVNLTSRIESYTVGEQVLISERTLKEAGREGDGIDVTAHIEVRMKGFEDPVPVYSVSGVGAPFNLRMPRQEITLTELTQPIDVTYWPLDGKHVTDQSCHGHFVAAGDHAALIHAGEGLDVLDNLRIRLNVDGFDDHGRDDIYAKVIEDRGESNRYLLRFTGIPGKASKALSGLVSGS